MRYSIEFRPGVKKNLESLPVKEMKRIKRKIEALAENLPNPATTKMKGSNDFHKVRTGNYRIIYEIHNDTLVVLIVKVGHRKDVYKHLP